MTCVRLRYANRTYAGCPGGADTAWAQGRSRPWLSGAHDAQPGSQAGLRKSAQPLTFTLGGSNE